MKIRRLSLMLILGALAFGGMQAAAPDSAFALGGNCSASTERQERILDDAFRTRARCSSLQADTKARPVLIRYGLDSYGSYFTGLNRNYYTAWIVSIGAVQASVQLARV